MLRAELLHPKVTLPLMSNFEVRNSSLPTCVLPGSLGSVFFFDVSHLSLDCEKLQLLPLSNLTQPWYEFGL